MKKVLCSLMILLMASSTEIFSQAKKATMPAVAANTFNIESSDFEKIVAYIEKHGFAIKESGIYSDHQYTFIDKDKNWFAFIAARRNKKGMPSVSSPVSLISVWGHKKGIKDLKHFFGFNIDRKMLQSHLAAIGRTQDPDFEIMKSGYLQFLKRVKG